MRGTAPDESQSQPESPQSRRFPRLFGKSHAARPQAPSPTPTPRGRAASRQRRASPEPAGRFVAAADARRRGRCRAGQANDRVLDRQRSQAAPIPAAPRRRWHAAPATMHRTSAWQSLRNPQFPGLSIRTLAWPRRPGRPPRPSARPRRNAGQARPCSDHGPPRANSTSTPRAKSSPAKPSSPKNSPGFSTMMCNGNRVVARRVNLRADHPQLLTAILPHEVTHVVLADLFTDPANSALGRRGYRRSGRAARRAADPRGRAARAPRSRPGLRPEQADGHGLPRRQGLEPLLRPERIA